MDQGLSAPQAGGSAFGEESSACPGQGLVTEDGRNAQRVTCPQCGSILLLPGKAALHQRPIALHRSRIGTAGEAGEREELEWHWKVGSMFDFENMGFSNTLSVDRPAKYLTCADCEQDVLGVHFLDEPDLYLATSRVTYSSS
jgi:hypothetical protein